jgi:hypothetical protein
MKHLSARILGIVLQSLVLGFLLFSAILQLAALSAGARIFRYQGF